MPTPFPETFVLFVDMLGFADLVEAEGDELSPLSPIFTGAELYSPSPADSLLGYRFINFHKCLEAARSDLQRANAGTAIAFSDSAFFRIDTLDQALGLARSLMYALVTTGVPARMGLARGSFRLLRFVTDMSAQVSLHMSQFLGTGVVRAYRAERCGAPGLRIFLHPLLDPLLERTAMRIVDVAPTPERLPVTSELNYLEESPTTYADSSLDEHYADVIPFDQVASMAAESDDKFNYHYVATYNALNLMRAQYGRPEYPWAKFVNRDEYMQQLGLWPPKNA